MSPIVTWTQPDSQVEGRGVDSETLIQNAFWQELDFYKRAKMCKGV